MSDAPAPNTHNTPKSMDAIMALCKRRGFIFQASDIYGGINGFWDYGPLGAQMKKNLREAWWQDMIMNPAWGRKGPNGDRVKCVPVETRIIQHPKVWEASGHVGGFNDPMQTCRFCKKLLRADHVRDMMRESAWVGELMPVLDVPTNDRLAALTQWVAKRAKKVAPGLRALLQPEASRKEFTERNSPGVTPFEAVLLAGGQYPTVTEGLPIMVCPNCGGELTAPRQFNLMFATYIGAAATEEDKAYLRPETAQGIFVQFKNVVDSTRVKMPFGIGNTGTSFRNEVTPRNFTYRSREFDQAELEFFCHPDESQDWYRFWRDFRMEWWQSIGLAGENLILREHDKDELSHYSCGTSDVEYRFPFTSPGFGELEGIAHRGHYDLTQHAKHSGAKLEYFDQSRGEKLPNGSTKGERYMPHCIEPAAGLDRGVLALLCEAYTVDPTRPSPELMKFHPRIAPIKAAIFPLVKKEGMPEIAQDIYRKLKKRWNVFYDEKGAVGRRYRRQDEVGTPYCITVDGQTLQDGTVTMRDRDSLEQKRVHQDQLIAELEVRLA